MNNYSNRIVTRLKFGIPIINFNVPILLVLMTLECFPDKTELGFW